MTLIGNRVLVESEVMDTWRGIAIPEDITHCENPFMDERIGTVVAVGTGRRTKKGALVPVSVMIGDRVLLPRNDKVRMDYNGKPCWLCNADSILGRLE